MAAGGSFRARARNFSASAFFEQPIIGLAKEFEEIYRPGRPLAFASARRTAAL